MRAISTHNVWLNGAALSAVDAAIVVRHAIEPETKANIAYIDNSGRSGRRIVSHGRESKIIRARFSIRGLYNLEERARVIDRVNGWAAAGGYLRISARPEQRIRVSCIKYAATDEVISPAGIYTLEFEANMSPFWEAAAPTHIDLSGAEATGEIVIRGTAPSPIEIEATPTGAALTSLVITATGAKGESAITLTGLNVPADTALAIGYDGHGFLSIAAGGVSLLDKRTPESSDELTAWPGVATISITANTAVDARIISRGRWV